MFKERVLKEGPWHEGGDLNSMWMKMSTCIRKVALEEFRVTKGGKHETKETWWWNETVQNAIKEKKECFRHMHLDRSVDNVERYKVAKKTEQRAVSEARVRCMMDYTSGWVRRKGRRTSIGWPKPERGRRGTSSN
jgi:hypothetical protein